MSKPKTIEGRRPVTKEDYPKLLQDALALDEAPRRQVSEIVTTFAEGRQLQMPMGVDVILYSTIVETALVADRGSGTITKDIKKAFWLTDENIASILRRHGIVPPGENPTPLLPGFENLDAEEIWKNLGDEDKFVPGIHSALAKLPTANVVRCGWAEEMMKQGELVHRTTLKAENGKQLQFTLTTALPQDKDSRYPIDYSRVEVAVGNLYDDGHYFQTDAMIYRQANGISGKALDRNLSKAALQSIHSAMIFLTTTKEKLEGEGVDERVAGKNAAGVEGYIIQADWTWTYRKEGRKLIRQEGWRIYRPPMSYLYSKMINQYTQTPLQLFGSQTRSNTTPEGNMRFYLLEERNRIRVTEQKTDRANAKKPLKSRKTVQIKDRKCLFDTIFKAAQIEAALATETTATGHQRYTKAARTVRERRILEIADILNSFVAGRHISKWEFVAKEKIVPKGSVIDKITGNYKWKSDADGVAIYVKSDEAEGDTPQKLL